MSNYNESKDAGVQIWENRQPFHVESPSAGVTMNPIPSNNITVVRTAQVMVGPNPIQTTCPGCEKFIMSRISKKNNVGKYVCCLFLFLSGVCLPCACIPLCVWSPVKTSHFCPNCKAFLGMYVA